MKKTKLALLHSLIALLLCVSMLVGTTFAWFTDSVTSMKNIIQAGNLDIELEYLVDGEWKSVKQDTNVFDEDTLWEPGHTEVVYLRISNKGSLALKYQLGVNVVSETPGINVDNQPFKLSDYIKMGVVEGVSTPYATRDEARDAVTTSGTLSSGYVTYGKMLANDPEQYITLVVYMPEEVDNVANYRGDAVPTIHLGINLLATQQTAENDSFGPDYDEGAKHPLGNINFTSTQSVADKVENGLLTEDVTVGDANGEIYAEVPNGVKLADGADSLELIVQAMQNSQADIQLEAGESKQAFNIHMDGVAEDNTVPMLITIEKMFKPDLNSTSVAMYHVENGQTIAMTSVALADLDAHNEFYYDVSNGNVILCVATFSEYVAVTNDKNPWKGNVDTDWYKDADTVFTLNTAEKFAGFGLLVDGGNTFDGKTIKLGADINLEGFDAEGNRYSFNPIGCGYEDSTINSNGVEGRVFKGIFDGQGHEITGLYQNGWEIGLSYCNLGGGLFASVKDATIQNLTIRGAEIVMECVEQGVVAGLVQGSCTFANINIYGCSVANYQKATGGLIGEVSGEGTTTIQNVVIGSDVVVGSLWGDFDAPVGGVIGARWDNENANPQIVMTNVTVAARLDVYNDVTSAYQWYAYRRAGMLIGNTETSATTDGRTVATADFLKCNNVKVCYGDWVNYHYCEFTNQDDAWQNGYPWVRVEAGKNCSAYSNPRYGHPVVGGVAIENDDHTCTAEHRMLIAFNQLYGGGQGVYGQPEHKGVTISNYAYVITYINDSKVLATTYVTDNSVAVYTENDDAAALVNTWISENGYSSNVTFGGWMNAGSTIVTEIEKDNTEDIILYPSFKNLYTAMFIDQEGEVLDWMMFTTDDKDDIVSMGNNLVSSGKVVETEELKFDYWEVHVTDTEGNTTTKEALDDYTLEATDIAIYPVYTYEGDVNLIPIDNDGDGDTDEYQVGGYSNPDGQNLVEIPDSVNGIKVTSIAANAFASYDGVHAVVIPKTIATTGGNILATDWGNIFDAGETVTIYFAGSYDEWVAIEPKFDADWEAGLGEGSRIFFLNGGDKVDAGQKYLQASFDWAWSGRTVEWTRTDVTSALVEEYTGKCDCENCDGATRPDAAYWEDVTVE